MGEVGAGFIATVGEEGQLAPVDLVELAQIGGVIRRIRAKSAAIIAVGQRCFLHQLQPGDKFRVVGLDQTVEGTLLRISQGLGSASVRIDKGKDRVTITDGAGATHTFDAKKASTTTWSAGTWVLKIADAEPDFGSEGKVAGPAEEEAAMEPVSLKPSDQGKERKQMAKTKGGNGNGKSAGKAKVAKSAKAENDCLDGCGAKVAKRFKPGHDSRFYSMLKKVGSGEMKFGALPAIVQREAKSVAGAAALVKAHG